MILTALASHPDVAPVLLSRLTSSALAGQLPEASREQVLRALLENPHLSDDDVTAIAAHGYYYLELALARPTMTAAAAIALLGRRPKTPALRAALRHVADPDAILVRFALATAPGARIWQEILALPHAPADVRVSAAASLADRTTHTQTDMADIWNVALVHPEHRERILQAAAADPDLATYLTEKVANLGKNLRTGSPTWLSHPGTSTQQVIAFATRLGLAGAWAKALDAHADPTGRLARAAMDWSTRRARSDTQVLRRILTGARTPDDVRIQALAAWPAGTRTPHTVTDAILPLLPHAPVDAVSAYASAVRNPREVRAILTRTDLTPRILNRLTHGAHTHRRARYDRAMRSLLDPLIWGVVLATHMNSDRATRAAGLEMVRADQEPVPGWNGRPDTQPASALALATLGQDLADLPAHVVGRRIPLDALSNDALVCPPVTALVAATLTHHMPALSNTEAFAVLVSLSGHLTGTLGDLLDVTATVVA